MAAPRVTPQRQQRKKPPFDYHISSRPNIIHAELQTEYQNYKNTLQQLAQKIGDIEQETEEHK
jgi:hypothetical protein